MIPGTSDDAVASKFMSRRNIDNLHRSIVRDVFEASKGEFRIGKQSEQELLQIMRAMYLEHAKHLPHAIDEQVAELNAKVLEYAVPQIVSEVRMHLHYLADRDQAKRATRPATVLVSSAGHRSELEAPSRAYFSPGTVANVYPSVD